MALSRKATVESDRGALPGALDALESKSSDTDLDDTRPITSSKQPVTAYLTAGQKIADRYEVINVLGEGGMGVVYRCREPSGELVAVKRVTLPETNVEQHLHMFVAEAEALAGLDHPNIVRARDFGQLRDGTPYLVMDLVLGTSLQQVTATATAAPVLWTLIDQILAALAHAHARGIVHGDLTPSNVLVEADARGHPKVRLFDFGIARRRRVRLDPRLGQKPAPSHPPPSAGTRGYMAPEQILALSSEICEATDLYALGCILYRILSGQKPRAGKASGELERQRFESPELTPTGDVPPGMIEFVMRLLRKRLQRVASAAEARRAWSRFRPEGALQDGGTWYVPSTLRPGASDPTDPEPKLARRAAGKRGHPLPDALRRSRRWLPGLLGVRPSPLVGRAILCARLAKTFEQIAGSAVPQQQAVVLIGPSGIGKSRIADWLCADVEERGTGLVLRGCQALAGACSDALAVALADRLNPSRGDYHVLPRQVADQCEPAELAAAIDWIVDAVDPSDFEPATKRHPRATASALLHVIHALGAGRAILLWLDDLATLQPETIELVSGFSSGDTPLRLMIVATVRSEDLKKPVVADAMGALRTSLRTDLVRVPPLDSLTTSAMLRAALPIDPALALRIAIESEGVPLDALKRLYALARAGAVE